MTVFWVISLSLLSRKDGDPGALVLTRDGCNILGMSRGGFKDRGNQVEVCFVTPVKTLKEEIGERFEPAKEGGVRWME